MCYIEAKQKACFTPGAVNQPYLERIHGRSSLKISGNIKLRLIKIRILDSADAIAHVKKIMAGIPVYGVQVICIWEQIINIGKQRKHILAGKT